MKKLPLFIDKRKIRDCCKRHHITYLALFGSVLTSHFTTSSDVDIIVKFDKNHIPGLFGISDIQEELTQIVGREVDLKTPNSLSRYFRDQVLTEAQVLYGK
ncbi:MAG: nucleotidyltransferase [Chlamydiae bacterium]|nr:nucleotidyltransferase [Chlamydiota bacterium]